MGVASNFDARLHAVLGGFPELSPARGRVVVSSQLGWRKPAEAFFGAVASAAGRPPHEILYVGDDAANDYDGARASGLAAVLLDPRGRCKNAVRIERLAELSGHLSGSGRG